MLSSDRPAGPTALRPDMAGGAAALGAMQRSAAWDTGSARSAFVAKREHDRTASQGAGGFAAARWIRLPPPRHTRLRAAVAIHGLPGV